ncbi:MAG: HNH endonuclease [Planctomycetota bacterium]
MTTMHVLSQPTLVLNRSWVAIDTTSAGEAIRLLFKGAAKVVRPETYEAHEFDTWTDLAVAPDEPCIRTPTLRIRIPEVITLTNYDKVPQRSVAFTRRHLFERDRRTCQYCGKRPGTAELTIDHVVPRSHGGKSTWQNCVLACIACNRRKADRTPSEAHMRLRREAKAPRWRPTINVPFARMRQSWQQFVSDRYWNVPLEP